MKGNNKQRNEKYYPLCFLVMFPLIGFFAAYEYDFMNGDTSRGMMIGLVAGGVSYIIYKFFSMKE